MLATATATATATEQCDCGRCSDPARGAYNAPQDLVLRGLLCGRRGKGGEGKERKGTRIGRDKGGKLEQDRRLAEAGSVSVTVWLCYSDFVTKYFSRENKFNFIHL